MNNFIDWKIHTKRLYIGSGAYWEVYRAFLEKEQSINGFTFSQFIYKINKNNSEFDLMHNITMYDYVKNTSIPTLEYYFSEVIDGIKVIIAEDLNANNKLFVSPNNSKNSTNKDILYNYISNNKIREFDENAEETLENNKILENENFESFLNKVSFDSIELSQNQIGCCEDMFFFGAFKNQKKTELFYKVADFDTIIKITDYHIKGIDNLALRNEKTILQSLFEYITIFIDDSIKCKYQNILSKKIEEINKLLNKKNNTAHNKR